jgi:hypothetical protein
MKNKTIIFLLLIAPLLGCATTPDFGKLGSLLDDTAAKARTAIKECEATYADEQDVADCIQPILDGLASATNTGVEAARQICAEVEASTDARCKGLD